MCRKTMYYGTSNTKIDKCMRPLIKWLNKAGHKTVASCCGHGKYPITIVSKPHYGVFNFTVYELLSHTKIPRIRRFYKKDKQGYYYIPEVVKEKKQ